MLWIIAGCLLMGVSSAIVGSMIDGDTVFLYLFVAFLSASIIGMVVHRVRSGRWWPDIRWRDVAVLNLATLMTFGAFYLAIVWIPASLAAGIEAAFAPVVALILGRLAHRRVPALTWGLALTVLACSIAFGAAQNESLAIPLPQYLIGVTLALLAGLAMAVLARISRRLGRSGVSASEVLAVRYHLAWVVALIIALQTAPLDAGLPGLLETLRWIVPLGITAMVLPLLLIQTGTMRTDPTLTTIIMAGLPAVAFATEATLLHAPTNALSWVLLTLLVLLISSYGVRATRATEVG